MYHSITFGASPNTKNTWTDWNLIPESPPVISAPKPNTNFVEIPGRIKGPIDASLIPFGHQTYERITGTWVFVMRDDYWHTPNPQNVYDTIRSWLHGKRTKIVLEDDSTHAFYGVFTVEAPQRSKGPFAIQITYDLEPVRYNSNGTVDTTWLPAVSSWVVSS